ncbi:unnamed protein product [Strongylus vulgaris]|uniref:Uncharacterized protein n=1 Tax=Strongylus vulgaris TaxID=40348 RepID=A0A3P7KHW1_STRVU|nr:unnamed protein product [Strongylus vulgaris]
MGISSPIHNRCEWRHSRVCYLMLVVIIGSLSLTAFHHFEYKYGYATMCNGTLTYAKLVPIERVRSQVIYFLSPWRMIFPACSLHLQPSSASSYDTQNATNNARGHTATHRNCCAQLENHYCAKKE